LYAHDANTTSVMKGFRLLRLLATNLRAAYRATKERVSLGSGDTSEFIDRAETGGEVEVEVREFPL